eukprot:jgi/Orpsp1_1/1181380/evm.model.c7180000077019.1
MKLKIDTSNIQYDEFIFYNLEINDTYRAELIGTSQSFCLETDCDLSPIKVIGIPGVYTLKLIINGFGPYVPFENNYIDIPIEIRECNNSTYVNNNIESQYFKSCYLPYCEFSCNLGKCVNNNICDCQGTHYTGKFCDQYFKLERIKKLDDLINILSTLLLSSILIIGIFTILQRENPNIKG